MQSQIPRINAMNHKRTLAEALNSTDREGTFCAIKDVIELMPHRSLLISNFINDLVRSDESFENGTKRLIGEISNGKDIDALISAAFTIKRLGFDGSHIFSWVENIPVIQSSLLHKATFVAPPKELLEKCSEKVIEVVKVAGKDDFEKVLYAMQIIRNFEFSIQECLAQLGSVYNSKQLVAAIRLLHNRKNILYISALAIELARKKGFLKDLLSELPGFDAGFRDTLLSLLFESFYSRPEDKSVYPNDSYVPLRFDEEVKLFDSLVTDETMRVMETISGASKVREFFPDMSRNDKKPEVKSINREEFENIDFKDREGFFRGFCHLGSPSISHFLTYLEIYKDHFVLSEEDQKLFLSVFCEMFDASEVFGDVIIGKMILFKILDQELVSGSGCGFVRK